MARRNLSTNPSAQNDLTGWLTNRTLTRVTGLAGYSRTTGGRITGGGTGEDWIIPAPASFPVGQRCSIGIDVNAPAATDIRVYLLFAASNQATLAEHLVNGGTFEHAGGTVRYTLSPEDVSPASTAFAGVQVSLMASAATLTVTGCHIEFGPTAGPYQDGADTGWKWDGTAGSSASRELITLTADVATALDTAALLAATRPLASEIDTAADQAATTAVQRGVAAVLDTATNLDTHLGAERALTGQLDAAGDLGALLAASRPLAGQLDTGVDATADLDVTGATEVTLTATLDVAAGVAAELRADRPLTAITDTATGLAALLSTHRALTAQLDTAVGITADLTVQGATQFAATVDVTADLTAALAAGRTLVVAIDAAAGWSAALTVLPPSTVAWPICPGTVTVRGTRPGTVTVVAIRPGTVH